MGRAALPCLFFLAIENLLNSLRRPRDAAGLVRTIRKALHCHRSQNSPHLRLWATIWPAVPGVSASARLTRIGFAHEHSVTTPLVPQLVAKTSIVKTANLGVDLAPPLPPPL